MGVAVAVAGRLGLVRTCRRRPRPSCRVQEGRGGWIPRLELLVGLEPAPAARQHDRADRGDQQQQRGDLEREQVLGQEQLADVLRACRSRARRARPCPRCPSAPSRASRCTARSRARSRTAGRGCAPPDRERSPRRRRRRRPRTRTGPSPRPRRRSPGRRRRTRPAAAGTAPPARSGGRRARARCRTGCAASPRRSRRITAPIAAMKNRTADIGAGYSPSERSGVRSIGSASSISLVKIRSERV
jgi:hypothetical protein